MADRVGQSVASDWVFELGERINRLLAVETAARRMVAEVESDITDGYDESVEAFTARAQLKAALDA